MKQLKFGWMDWKSESTIEFLSKNWFKWNIQMSEKLTFLFFIKFHQNKDGRVRLKFQNKHVLLNNLSLAEPMSNLIVDLNSS